MQHISPRMKTIRLIFIILTVTLLSCKGSEHEHLGITEINSSRIEVNDDIKENEEISGFIAPYKEHLNKTLDSVLAHNPRLLSKNDGDMNTALGNLMADAVMIQANPVIQKSAGRDIDLVLLNHGGIRAELPAGGITTRSAYNLMPFENEIVVAELTGKQIRKMLKYLEKAKKAHPVSGIQIRATKNFKIIDASINGKQIEEDETYLVATSDYLSNGGDNMQFFKEAVNMYKTGYKVRNSLIDYFTKIDTIRAEKDQRYIRE